MLIRRPHVAFLTCSLLFISFLVSFMLFYLLFPSVFFFTDTTRNAKLFCLLSLYLSFPLTLLSFISLLFSFLLFLSIVPVCILPHSYLTQCLTFISLLSSSLFPPHSPFSCFFFFVLCSHCCYFIYCSSSHSSSFSTQCLPPYLLTF